MDMRDLGNTIRSLGYADQMAILTATLNALQKNDGNLYATQDAIHGTEYRVEYNTGLNMWQRKNN